MTTGNFYNPVGHSPINKSKTVVEVKAIRQAEKKIKRMSLKEMFKEHEIDPNNPPPF